MSRSYHLGWIAGVAMWTAASPESAAFAQDKSSAALVRRGVELRRAGHDAEALEVFRLALAQGPSARIRAQVGLAEEALGDWVAAEQDIMGASIEPDDGWLDRNSVALEEALRDVRSHLATIDVHTNVEGAELWTNGKLRGRLPGASRARVAAGETTIEVRADGYESQMVVVILPAGGELRQTLALGASEKPVSFDVVPSRWDAGSPPAALLQRPPPPSPPRADSSPRTFAWALVGTSACFLAGGLAAQIVADANAAAYNDDSRCFFGTLTRDQRCGASRDRAESAQAVAVAGYAIGAAAALGSIFLFVSTHRQEPRTASFTCEPSVASVICNGRF